MTLTFDLDPLSFGMMVTNTLIILYTNDDVPKSKIKEVEKNQF
jgi:hypothetical protein